MHFTSDARIQPEQLLNSCPHIEADRPCRANCWLKKWKVNYGVLNQQPMTTPGTVQGDFLCLGYLFSGLFKHLRLQQVQKWI